MKKTICDRCGRVIEGQKSVVGLWGPGGRTGTAPGMGPLPEVCVMDLCSACRKAVEAAMLRQGPQGDR